MKSVPVGKERRNVDEDFIAAAQRAAALGVLTVMSSFDDLLRESGVDE